MWITRTPLGYSTEMQCGKATVLSGAMRAVPAEVVRAEL